MNEIDQKFVEETIEKLRIVRQSIEIAYQFAADGKIDPGLCLSIRDISMRELEGLMPREFAVGS